jgi:hypothetical protein
MPPLLQLVGYNHWHRVMAILFLDNKAETHVSLLRQCTECLNIVCYR